MPVAGEMMVKLAADVAELKAGFAQAQQTIQDFASAATTAIKSIAFEEIARRVTSFIKSQYQAALAVDDMAQALGVSRDALILWGQAAAKADVSTDDFTKGLFKLQETMTKAAQGNREAIEFFKRMGVPILDAKGNLVDLEKILPDVMRAVTAMGSAAERNAVLVRLWGEEGKKLAERLMEVAHAADAPTEVSQKYNELIEASKTLSDHLKALGTTAETTFGPWWYDALTKIVRGFDGVLLAVTKFDAMIVNNAATLADWFSLWSKMPFVGPVAEQLEAFMRKLDDMRKRAEAARIAGTAPGWAGGITPEAEVTADLTKRSGVGYPLARGEAERNKREADRLAAEEVRRREKAMDALEREGRRYDMLVSKYSDTGKVRVAMGELDEAFAKGVISVEQYNAAVDKLSERWQLGRIEELWGPDVRQAVESLGDAFTQLGANVYDAMFTSGISVKQFVASFLKDVGRMVFQMMVWTPIIKAFMEMIRGWVIGAGGGGENPAQRVSASAAAVPIAGGRQSGGAVWPGVSFMVGERGPERFIPSVPGTIEPAGGAGDTNVTINIAGVESTTGQDERQQAAALARKVRAAVLDVLRQEKRPGGMLAQGA